MSDRTRTKEAKAMKLYKLTDENGRTKGDTQWGEGVTHNATGEGQELCSDGYIHAYEHPLLAAILNPIHADFSNPLLWEAKGRVSRRKGLLKCGCKTLTTVRQIPLPEITNEQRGRFAIGCAWPVCDDPAWRRWAVGWLDGSDRSSSAAAEEAAAAKAEAAKAEAAKTEAWAAARAAARAAASAEASTSAAWAAAWAAWAAEEAAEEAARSSASAATDLDLIVIAEWAMTDKPIEALKIEKEEK